MTRDRTIQRIMGWDDRVALPRDRSGRVIVGLDPSPPSLMMDGTLIGPVVHFSFSCQGQVRRRP